MQQNQLKPNKGSRHAKKRIGRGDTFAGRGVKGQLSRVGKHKALRAGFEGGQTPLFRRMPKLGGFKNINRIAYQAVNLADLEQRFVGDVVDVATLKTAGLIRAVTQPVKILGVGTLTKKLAITAHAASEKAKAAIEKAGGTLTLVDPRSVARQKAVSKKKKVEA